MTAEVKSVALRWLLRALLFLCLGTWLVIRLCVPFGGMLPDTVIEAAAFLLSGVILAVLIRFRAAKWVLSIWEKPWQVPVIALPAFLLGWVFDISYSMSVEIPFLFLGPPMDILCHAGNGLVLAAIVLTFLRALRDLKGLGRVNRLQIIVIYVLLNLVTLLYVLTSHSVYVWDTAGYWTIARILARETFDRAHIINILETTLSLDYNYLLAFPISLLMRLFGGSRAVYIFAVSNLYTFPALWAITALANQKKWSGLVLCGLFPLLAYTGLVGFVDVICCGMGVWAYIVYTSDRPPVSRGIFTGFLLIFSLLFRRYFIFFAASFGMAALLLKVFCQRKESWKDFIALCGSSAVCATAFALNFLIDRVMGPDYSDIYSAYGLGLYSDFLNSGRYLGLVPLVLILVAAVVDFANRKDRPMILFGLSQALICCAAFLSVQTHGQQHMLLYIPALAFLTIYALSRAPQYMSSLLAMAMAVYCFFPKPQPTTVLDIDSPDLFPSFHFYGPSREDIDQLVALRDYLDGLSVQEGRQVSATILASSFAFNGETLIRLRPSLNLKDPEVVSSIRAHASVDKRDAFNWNTAFSDYLVVGDPVQTHLGEENQEIIALLARHILQGTGPGKAYEELPETFHLEDGITVHIYRRTRTWTLDEYRTISEPLQKMYPKYADLYAVPSWIK